jgi:hypothetical protein
MENSRKVPNKVDSSIPETKKPKPKTKNQKKQNINKNEQAWTRRSTKAKEESQVYCGRYATLEFLPPHLTFRHHTQNIVMSSHS